MTFKVTETEQEIVSEIASRNGVSASEVIRDAIVSYGRGPAHGIAIQQQRILLVCEQLEHERKHLTGIAELYSVTAMHSDLVGTSRGVLDALRAAIDGIDKQEEALQQKLQALGERLLERGSTPAREERKKHANHEETGR